jgi:hypothetical protein
VDDVLGMHIIKSKEDLIDDLGSRLLIEVLKLHNAVVEFSTLK